MLSTKHLGLQLLAGIVIGTLARLPFIDSTEGSHFWTNPYKHIGSMNNLEYERFCVDVTAAGVDNTGSPMTQTRADNLIADALYRNAVPPDEDWDGLDGGKVTFVPYQCAPYPLDYMKIRFWIMEDAVGQTLPQCSATVACQRTKGPTYQDPTDPGHDVYTRSEITIQTQNLLDDQNTVVNHEVGHSLGLADQEGYPCGNSIMHSCQQIFFPTVEDLASVAFHISSGGGGGMGGGGGGSKI